MLTNSTALLRKFFLFGGIIWLLQRGGMYGWGATLLTTLALLAQELLQTQGTSGTPEVTDPLLAAVLGALLMARLHSKGHNARPDRRAPAMGQESNAPRNPASRRGPHGSGWTRIHIRFTLVQWLALVELARELDLSISAATRLLVEGLDSDDGAAGVPMVSDMQRSHYNDLDYAHSCAVNLRHGQAMLLEHHAARLRLSTDALVALLVDQRLAGTPAAGTPAER